MSIVEIRVGYNEKVCSLDILNHLSNNISEAVINILHSIEEQLSVNEAVVFFSPFGVFDVNHPDIFCKVEARPCHLRAKEIQKKTENLRKEIDKILRDPSLSLGVKISLNEYGYTQRDCV